MFTGIIEEVGKIERIQRQGEFAVLTIKGKKVLEDAHLGDSIAVNGVCLTVTAFGENYFSADVMAETLHRTSLGELQPNSPVNLERAMSANGRFGGHIVSGHIDGIGKVAEIRPADNAVWYTIKTEPKIMRYIIEKGSITIDGISLTVVDCDERQFRVSIIPHTIKETNLGSKKVGSIVNLENDVVGKYVEKLLGLSREETPQSKISEDFLKQAGF